MTKPKRVNPRYNVPYDRSKYGTHSGGGRKSPQAMQERDEALRAALKEPRSMFWLMHEFDLSDRQITRRMANIGDVWAFRVAGKHEEGVCYILNPLIKSVRRRSKDG